MKRPWNNRLIYTFFLSYLAIIILLALGFFLYSRNLLRDFYASSLGKVMEQKTQVLARQLPWSDKPGSLDSICRTLADELGVRITVIAQNGEVIGDSDEPSDQMENHGSRPEVIEALSRGAGSAVRYRARFWSSDASALRDLFQIVGGSDATEVLIDDRPVPYARELWLPLVWFLIPR